MKLVIILQDENKRVQIDTPPPSVLASFSETPLSLNEKSSDTSPLAPKKIPPPPGDKIITGPKTVGSGLTVNFGGKR